MKSNVTAEHKKRVKDELRSVGVSGYGLLKQESKYLPQVIHEDEHIMGVAMGLTKEKYSAMLVATDHRVIFLDKKPGFTVTDEINYDMVAGIGHNAIGKHGAIILHTRMGDFKLTFVNLKVAQNFIQYVEKRRLEGLNSNPEGIY